MIGLMPSIRTIDGRFLFGTAATFELLPPGRLSSTAGRLKGVRGLAVAGMPIGSPGMEVPGIRAQRYNVIAFGAARTSIYAQH